MILARPRAVEAAVYGIVLLLLLIGAWMQAQVHLNHDVGWITHSAGWMLEGRRFGSEIVDVNPPLIWFMSLPAAAMAKAGWMSEATAIRVYVWLLCLVSLFLCSRLLRGRRGAQGVIDWAAPLCGAAFAMAVLPAAGFAQREHLAFVLGLPYVLLIVTRLDGGTTPAARMAIGCGVLGGIAFGFKPWLLAVPLLLEVMHLGTVRTLRSVWRPETIAMGATLVAYVVAVFVFCPDYFRVGVPLALATYWAYENPRMNWRYWQDSLPPVVVAGLCLAIARQFPVLARALFAAFIGFSISNWAQRKGYGYHAYPALASAVVLLAAVVPEAARALARSRIQAEHWIKAGMAFTLVAVAANTAWQRVLPVRDWLKLYDMRTGKIGAARSKLIEVINHEIPGKGYVYALSSHPFPAFPIMSYTYAEYGSAFVCQFAVPADVRRKEIPDAARLPELDAAVQLQRQYVIDEFTRHEPGVVLIEAGARLGMPYRRFDDIAYYGQDPRFAAIWSQYEERAPIGSIRIFVRWGGSSAARPAGGGGEHQPPAE